MLHFGLRCAVGLTWLEAEFWTADQRLVETVQAALPWVRAVAFRRPGLRPAHDPIESALVAHKLRWRDHIAINIYWLGLNVASGTITPVLLPFLVALFVPAALKNTYLSHIRVISLAAAMLVQPLAGMLSDRSTSRWGRRRPFIVAGTLLDVLFLAIVGLSFTLGETAQGDPMHTILGLNPAYAILLLGIVLLQISSNIAHGALQGLIPDLVPAGQRGRASGIKAVMELLPAFLVIIMGPLVDGGQVWLTIGIIAAALLCTMALAVLLVHERPLQGKPEGALGKQLGRLLALTAVFVAVTQGAVWLTRASGDWLSDRGAAIAVQVIVVGAAGLAGMAGAIFLGVYLGIQMGIGQAARQHSSFTWWVINRLLFLAAIGSIQGFAQFFLSDVLEIPNAATTTTLLLGVVVIFLLPAALGGGMLADRVGRKRLVAYSGLVAGAGTLLLLFSTNIPLVLLSGCIIGLGAGVFLATNWALGTDLIPPHEAGRYLGISNLAGAGAGIVGVGIGGPMADFFNGLEHGLGYLVVFGLYAALFFLSTAVLTRIHPQAA